MFFENGGDYGKALSGFRAQGFDAGDTVQGVLYRLSDQGFHLFGRQAWSFGLDDYFGWGELRVDVVFGVLEDIDSVGCEDAGQGYDYAAKADGEVD